MAIDGNAEKGFVLIAETERFLPEIFLVLGELRLPKGIQGVTSGLYAPL